MKKNKYLPYIIFGLPILIGGFFLYKYVKSKKEETADGTTEEPSTGTTTPTTPTYTQKNELPIKRGNKGGYVIAIQRVLGLKQDGLFGSKTESSVKAFQKAYGGLAVDGIVGAKTWKALFGADFPNEIKRTQAQIDAIINPNVPTYILNPNPTPKEVSIFNPTF